MTRNKDTGWVAAILRDAIKNLGERLCAVLDEGRKTHRGIFGIVGDHRDITALCKRIPGKAVDFFLAVRPAPAIEEYSHRTLLRFAPGGQIDV
jgi:hypothetical protein